MAIGDELGNRRMSAGVGVWSSPAWRRDALAWVDARLREHGLRRTGEPEQPHLYPWATALRVPTTAGPVWLKASAPGTAFEAGLYELLAEAAPDHVLVPLATDPARGWTLLPDGGPSLGDRLSGEALADAMEAALPQYGELQRAVAPHADRLLALGVTDMRAAVMTRRFEEALAFTVPGLDDPDRRLHRRIEAQAGTIAAWCEELAAAPGPASIDHNDLHPYNVLGGDGHLRFYDWGDSVVAHPFACALVPLGFVQERVLGVEPDHPRVLRLRDAYLEGFGDLAPHGELVATLELACRVAKIARAHIWHRSLEAAAPGEVEPRFARAPLETLASLLDATYLGRT
jgi:Phosphotransferase enzyme family